MTAFADIFLDKDIDETLMSIDLDVYYCRIVLALATLLLISPMGK